MKDQVYWPLKLLPFFVLLLSPDLATMHFYGLTTPDMFQSGLYLLPSSGLAPCEVTKNLGRNSADTSFLPFLICFLIHTSVGNFLDCHSLLPSPLAGWVWLTHWLSTPICGGTSLMALLSFWFHTLILGGLIQDTRAAFPPPKAQGLLAFRNGSSGTQHQILLQSPYSPLLQVLPVLCPCCS